MRNASNKISLAPRSSRIAEITHDYLYVPCHAIGSAANKISATGITSTEATLVGTNTAALTANPGYITSPDGTLFAILGGNDTVADHMNLQTLIGIGGLLIVVDVEFASNPAANVGIWGHITSSGATDGVFFGRITTAGQLDCRMQPIGGAEATIATGTAITTGVRQQLAWFFDCVNGTVQMYKNGAPSGSAGVIPLNATLPKRATVATNDYGITFGGKATSLTTGATIMPTGAKIGNGLVVRFESDKSTTVPTLLAKMAKAVNEPLPDLAGF